ncbi:MAG TPA: TolC family protein [Steroidobacteraceae bacterium]|nr:TolC family protein [Steroidobacteraceae bacterium]
MASEAKSREEHLLRRSAAICLYASLLVACAETPVAPQPEPVLAALPEHTWSDPSVSSTWSVLGGEGEFGTGVLSTTEAFAAALNFSPQMALARAQVEVGRAGVLVARQRPNPILSLSPEKVISALAGVSPWVAAVSLVWPVQTNGKRSIAIEQALAVSDSQLLAAATSVWTLRSAVRKAVCGAELAAADVLLAREELGLREDLAARLEKQSVAGLVSHYEAARARLERDGAAQRLRLAESDVIAAKHDVASVTGVSFAEVDRRTFGDTCVDAPAGGIDAVTGSVETAVASRLDIRAKLSDFHTADAAWRLELARRVPDLNLGPGYTYDQGVDKITFTISGELPISARNDAAIARAIAERNRVIAELEILQRNVIDGAARARDQLLAAEAQRAAAADAATQTQNLLERDIGRQKAGELDQPAVLASRIATVVARANAMSARRVWVDALASLELATQTPVVSPWFGGDAAQKLFAMPDPEEGKK